MAVKESDLDGVPTYQPLTQDRLLKTLLKNLIRTKILLSYRLGSKDLLVMLDQRRMVITK